MQLEIATCFDFLGEDQEAEVTGKPLTIASTSARRIFLDGAFRVSCTKDRGVSPMLYTLTNGHSSYARPRTRQLDPG